MSIELGPRLCGQMRDALNLDCGTEEGCRHCDCVIVKGGNFRGERDYDSHKFSMEALKSEMDGRERVHIFLIPGSVLKTGSQLYDIENCSNVLLSSYFNF